MGLRGLRSLRRDRTTDGAVPPPPPDPAPKSPVARPSCVPGGDMQLDVLEVVGVSTGVDTNEVSAAPSPALNVSPVASKSRSRICGSAGRSNSSYLASFATPPRGQAAAVDGDQHHGTATNLLDRFEGQGQVAHRLVAGTGPKLKLGRGGGMPVGGGQLPTRPQSRADGEVHESPGHRSAAAAAASAAAAEQVPLASPGARIAASATATPSIRPGSQGGARGRLLFRPTTVNAPAARPQPPSGPRRGSFRNRSGRPTTAHPKS